MLSHELVKRANNTPGRRLDCAALVWHRIRQPFFRPLEASIIREGGLDDRRISEVQGPFVRAVASWLHEQTTIPELQLRVKSMIILVTRYALMSERSQYSSTAPPGGRL